MGSGAEVLPLPLREGLGGRGPWLVSDPLPPTPSRKGSGSVCPAIFAAVVTLLASVAALAQPAPGWKPLSAKDLAIKCHASEPGPHAACIAYAQAIFDLQFAPAPPRGICTPPDLSPELLAEVVTAYVDTHEDGPAPAAVGQAIVRFFPCTEQHR
jgi:hypothetical protein